MSRQRSTTLSTYCHGYKLVAIKYITTHDVTTLCELLNDRFRDTPYTFLPEPITEGGIIFKGLESGYKSMRFYPDHLTETQRRKLMIEFKGEPPMHEKWPWIEDHDQVIDEWDFVEAKNLFLKDQTITIILKAFYGAPLWTIEELKIFEECFMEIGMVRKGKYPTKKSLSTLM